jgi:exodeoxyribonuclease VII large subunit
MFLPLPEFLEANGSIYGLEPALLGSPFYWEGLSLKERERVQTELFEQEEDRSTVWSITGLTQEIRKSLQTKFPIIWVRGEISNLRVQASGHRYFLLKDNNCQLKAVFFRGDASGSAYLPGEGDECLAYGEISVYEPRGEYQLRIRHLLQDGLGNLRLQFDRLKKKLLEEGLFEEERKLALPTFAQTIGIITSPDGAALQDFISILKRRNWTGNIWLIPSLVQGKEAPAQIINGVKIASKIPDIELLILARGGGSIEDLWAFNDEALVRAIADCPIPTISAIGHQTDFVLSDFVADLRAETPSAAAEWISSQYLEQIELFHRLEERLLRVPQDFLSRASDKLALVEASLEKLSPQAKMERHQQQLDDLEHRLQTCAVNLLERTNTNLNSIEQRLQANSLPSALKRGFSYLSDKEGNLVRSVKNLPAGKHITAHLEDGKRTLEALEDELG